MSARALLAAHLAAPRDAAAAAALGARLAADDEAGEHSEWVPLAHDAFAALRAAAPPPLRPCLLLHALEAAYAGARASLEASAGDDPQDVDALPAGDVADWLVALLRAPPPLPAADDEGGSSAQRAAAAALWQHVGRIGRHPRVAAAAAAAVAAAAAAGRATDAAAVDALCAFGCFAAYEHDGSQAACAAAIVEQPGCLAALVALISKPAPEEEVADAAADASTSARYDRFDDDAAASPAAAEARTQVHAFYALAAACAVPAGAAALLAAGGAEACAACVARERRWEHAAAAIKLLVRLACQGGAGAWRRLCAAGALPAVLAAPTLRPGERGFVADATLRFLTVAAAAARGAQAAAARAPLQPLSPQTQLPLMLKARCATRAHEEFHRRAALAQAAPAPAGGVAAPSGEPAGYWALAAHAALSSPGALAALADAEAFALAARAGYACLLSRLLPRAGAAPAAARAALLDACWPVWPLLRCAAAAGDAAAAQHGAGHSLDALLLEAGSCSGIAGAVVAPAMQHSSSSAPLLALCGASAARSDALCAVRELFRAWSDDGTTAILTAPPPHVPGAALAAAVSAALLAPRVPHLGAALARRGPGAALALTDALLRAAGAGGGVGSGDACTGEGNARYRLRALAAAVGTLAAETFPLHASTADVVAEHWCDEHDEPPPLRHHSPGTVLPPRVGPAFAWRRDAHAAAAAAATLRKPRLSGGDAAAASSAQHHARAHRHSLLTAADAGTHFAGCAFFAVSGVTVPAFALAMSRASPVLRDALDAAERSGSGGGSAATPIALPPLDGVSPAAQHAALLAAVEFVYTGGVAALQQHAQRSSLDGVTLPDVDADTSAADADALFLSGPSALLPPLWRLAHALRMQALKTWVMPRLVAALRACVVRPTRALCAGFELSQTSCCAALESACARALLAHIGDVAATAEAAEQRQQQHGRALRATGDALAALAEARGGALRAALANALADALATLFGPPAAEQ
jgi:hypothetical protein